MDFHTFPLHDYTKEELMALPANSRLLFAEQVSQGLLTYETPLPTRPFRSSRRRVIKPYPRSHILNALSKVRALRCMSHGMSAFSLYPTTHHQYIVNKFLWNAANQYSFKAHDAAALFQRNVFIISMPAQLFDFLTAVTWEQVEDAILFVLVSLAHDANGVQVLLNELAPPLAAKLANAQPPNSADSCDPTAFRLLLDLVMDKIMWTGPWVLPTTLCFLSASDMTELLARRYQRPIFATPEKFELVHTMMWSIYRDWQTYRHLLVRMGGLARLHALELMAWTISKGAQSLVERAVRTVLQLTAHHHDCRDIPFDVTGLQTPLPLQPGTMRKNYLAKLPIDIVLSNLLPKLCQAYAADENITRRKAPGASQHYVPDQGLPPRFSLKNWVLEDSALHQFYHNGEEEEEDDDDLSDIDLMEHDDVVHIIDDDDYLDTGAEADDEADDEAEIVEVEDDLIDVDVDVEDSMQVVEVEAVEALVSMDEEVMANVVDGVDSEGSVWSVESSDAGMVTSSVGTVRAESDDEVVCARGVRSQRRRLDENGTFQVVQRHASDPSF